MPGAFNHIATLSPLTSTVPTCPFSISHPRTALQNTSVGSSKSRHGQIVSHVQLSKYEPLRYIVWSANAASASLDLNNAPTTGVAAATVANPFINPLRELEILDIIPLSVFISFILTPCKFILRLYFLKYY